MNLSSTSATDLRKKDIDATSDAYVGVLHLAIQHLNHLYEIYWRGTPAEIVEFLNSIGAATASAAASAHNAQAADLNTLIEAALEGKPVTFQDRYTIRATTAPKYKIQQPGQTIPNARIRVTAAGIFELIPEDS